MKKVLDYSSCYGVVLSGEASSLRSSFRDFLVRNVTQIFRIIEESTQQLKVGSFLFRRTGANDKMVTYGVGVGEKGVTPSLPRASQLCHSLPVSEENRNRQLCRLARVYTFELNTKMTKKEVIPRPVSVRKSEDGRRKLNHITHQGSRICQHGYELTAD